MAAMRMNDASSPGRRCRRLATFGSAPLPLHELAEPFEGSSPCPGFRLRDDRVQGLGGVRGEQSRVMQALEPLRTGRRACVPEAHRRVEGVDRLERLLVRANLGRDAASSPTWTSMSNNIIVRTADSSGKTPRNGLSFANADDGAGPASTSLPRLRTVQ